MTRDRAAAELVLDVRCTRLSVDPKDGEPEIAAELTETVEKSATKITLKAIEGELATVLNDGLVAGRRYELRIELLEKPELQTTMFDKEAS